MIKISENSNQWLQSCGRQVSFLGKNAWRSDLKVWWRHFKSSDQVTTFSCTKQKSTLRWLVKCLLCELVMLNNNQVLSVFWKVVAKSLLHQSFQRKQVCVCVLGQNSSHSVSQLEQVLGVPPTGTSRAGDLVSDVLQGGGAEVVWVILRADVKQRLAGRLRVRRPGVKGHRDDLVAPFFSVVQVALHFLFSARRKLVGHAPHASLDREGRTLMTTKRNTFLSYHYKNSPIFNFYLKKKVEKNIFSQALQILARQWLYRSPNPTINYV